MTTPGEASESMDPLLPEEPLREQLLRRIDTLSANLWEDAIARVDVEQWLQNFNGSELSVESEHENALHLLSNFNLFGVPEVRELLRAIYRDLFRYPIIQKIRHDNGGTLDRAIIDSQWRHELNATRFLGMGNPSESGAHLLYYFRQVNRLRKDLFIYPLQALDGPIGQPGSRIAIPELKRLIFIDDVLGSGTQAVEYSGKFVQQIKQAAAAEGRDISVEYLVLFAKEEGLEAARSTEFDRVDAVHEIEKSEMAFSDESRIYLKCEGDVSRVNGHKIAKGYGEKMCPGHALGYKDGQLLLGFRHNIPDNTLPIIWYSGGPLEWNAAFPRFGKLY